MQRDAVAWLVLYAKFAKRPLAILFKIALTLASQVRQTGATLRARAPGAMVGAALFSFSIAKPAAAL